MDMRAVEAVKLLAETTMTVAAVAERFGVHPRTIRKWLAKQRGEAEAAEPPAIPADRRSQLAMLRETIAHATATLRAKAGSAAISGEAVRLARAVAILDRLDDDEATEPTPVDLDELRARLAERLAGLGEPPLAAMMEQHLALGRRIAELQALQP